MPNDTYVSTLVINEMTKLEYLEKQSAGELSDTELYFLTDDDGVIDEVLDTTSENAIQNKAVAEAINDLDEKIDSEAATLSAAISSTDEKATNASSVATTASTAAETAQAKADSAYDLAGSKQDEIGVIGILKGSGNGIVGTAVSGTDYEAPGAAAQALSDAKDYASGLNDAMETRMDAVESSSSDNAKAIADEVSRAKAAEEANTSAITEAKSVADNALAVASSAAAQTDVDELETRMDAVEAWQSSITEVSEDDIASLFT